jgi:multidrug efflux pump subunit AcrA (membrane-fusion protein)
MNTKHKKGKRKVVVWSVIVGVVVAMLAAAVLFSPKGSGGFEEEKAQTGTITTYYSFSGAVEAKSRQNIISKKEMHIVEVLVKEGDQVKKGDVLIKNSDGEEIKAEINGEVSKVYTKNDSHALQGSQLIDVVDFTNLQTNVKVDEYDLKYLEVGKEVNVTINALEKEITGTVSAISKEATNENGVSYFTATIDIAKDETIRVGMSAEAKILKQEAKEVTTITMKAVQFDSKNKPYVLLPAEKGTPEKKYIQTGINDGTSIEIKSGLEKGDVVMIPDTEKSEPVAMHGGNQ